MASLRYPLVSENGSLAITADENEEIKDQIMSVLETRPYERVMNSTYGTPDFIFSAVPSHNAVAERVRSQLIRQIPDTSFEVSGIINENNDYSLDISYDSYVQGSLRLPLGI